MELTFKSILLLIQLTNLVSNFVIKSKFNENRLNFEKIESISQNSSKWIQNTLKERINLCKTKFPDFDYESLNDNEKDLLLISENPCRMDCVVHRPRIIIFTLYFTDGNIECDFQKVCVSDSSHTYGICESVAINLTSTQYTTESSTVSTTMAPTTQMTSPSAISTENETIRSTQTRTETITELWKTSTSFPTTTTTTTTTTKFYTENIECPSARFYRDQKDPECHRFYRCIGSLNHYKRMDRQICPNGTMFDEPIQSCQYPDELKQPCPQK